MGLTTGFIGGFTLTTSLLYFSILLHRQNRQQQAALLRQNRLLITNIIEPLPEQDIPTRREASIGVVESVKDKWNSEVARLVRKVQTTDWTAVREGLEENAGAVWEKVRDSANNAK